VQAILLAAGKGTRLRPVTLTRPKPLVPIVNEPLLIRNLRILKQAGVDEVVIVAGYMVDKVEEAVRKERNLPKIKIVEQKERKGTGHALIQVEKFAKDEFLVVYGDLMFGKSTIAKVIEAGANSMAAVEVSDPWNYGVIEKEDGKLVRIVEKPRKGEEPSNLVNAGIYFLSSDVFSYLEHVGFSPRGEIELTDAVTAMVDDGVKVVKVDEWFEIGKPWNLLEANKIELERMEGRVEGEVEEGAVIKGNVVVEEGAVIESGSYVVGPAYIGKNAVVGPNAHIRPYTVIAEGARIGNATEVKESVIMEGVHAAHFSYIGNSVVCENVNLGAGTMIANLRFDGKEVMMKINGKKVSTGLRKFGAVIGANTKTGVNVSIMPGVRIAPNSWIMPGTVVYDDFGEME